MAIELKDVGDIEKFLNDTNAKLAEHEEKLTSIGDADGAGRKALEAQIKELRGAVDEVARRRMPIASGEDKDLVRPEHGQKLALGAILKAPTPVEKDGKGWKAPEGVTAQFQDASDDLYLLAKVLKLEPHQVRQTSFYQDRFMPAFEKMRAVYKEAFDTATAGEGYEWLAPMYSARLFEKVRLELMVPGIYEQFTMPRSTFTFPVQLADLTPYTYSENTASTGQTAITEGLGSTTLTGNVTFTGKGIATRALTSKFLEEDSIVPILPFLQRAVVQAVRNGLEDGCINGDITAVHRDADIEAISLHAASAWDGLRSGANAASAEVDAGGRPINTTVNFNAYVGAARAAMGKYGVNPADLALIVSPVGFNQLLQIEMFSTAASLVAGSGTNVLGRFGFRPFGMELIVSEYMKENLAATGVNTAGGPNIFTGMLVANRRGWMLGTVREITVQVLRELYAEYDQDSVLVTWRGDFQKMYGSSAKTEAFVYDVALA